MTKIKRKQEISTMSFIINNTCLAITFGSIRGSQVNKGGVE